METDHIVVACGGGGIPVYRTRILKRLKGIDAVIDKDFAAEKLAELVKADIFVSVTAVPNAYIDFGTPEARPLEKISAKEAEEYISKNYFRAGSMLPKMEAAVTFAKRGGTGIITDITNLSKALGGKAGTIVERN